MRVTGRWCGRMAMVSVTAARESRTTIAPHSPPTTYVCSTPGCQATHVGMERSGDLSVIYTMLHTHVGIERSGDLSVIYTVLPTNRFLLFL